MWMAVISGNTPKNVEKQLTESQKNIKIEI